MKVFLFAQLMISLPLQSFVVDEFELNYHWVGDRIFFEMSVNATGWILVGFNDYESISNSYLVFGRIKNGFSEVEDHYVLSPGNHVSLFELAEGAGIQHCKVIDRDGRKTLSFSLPKEATSTKSPHFSVVRKYLWLAYSNSKDFNHHSAKRIGRWISFNENLKP